MENNAVLIAFSYFRKIIEIFLAFIFIPIVTLPYPVWQQCILSEQVIEQYDLLKCE